MIALLELIYKFLILIGIAVLIVVLWPVPTTLVHALNVIAHYLGH